jgi:hypothetical protein
MEELQIGGPSARASGQRSHFLRDQGIAIDVAEKLFDFPGAEPEVIRTDFDQLPGDPQP